MKFYFKVYSLLIFLFFLYSIYTLAKEKNKAGNQNKNFPLKGIIAKLDTLKISAEEFYYGYEFGPAFVKREKESKEKYLNYLINEKLMALDGYSRGLDTTAIVVDMLKEYKNDLATEELFKAIY